MGPQFDLKPESAADLGVHFEPKPRQRSNSNSSTSSQSKREGQKDIVYDFSDAFKAMVGRANGTWRDCWKWIMEYADAQNLRIGTRKIRCDAVLKSAFDREESSVSGVSRLIWKHLIGSIEKDKDGKVKKLKYTRQNGEDSLVKKVEKRR